jgi:hypothetical protein
MIASACQWLAKLVQQVEHLKTHSGVIAQLRNFAVVDRKIAREERSNRCNTGSQW